MSSYILPFLNKIAFFDPKTEQVFDKLSGKILKFGIYFNDRTFSKTYRFSKNGLEMIPSQNPETIHLSMEGPVSAFLCLLMQKDPHKATQKGLTITGDTDMAMALQDFLFNLELDFGEAIALLTNDSLAFHAEHFIGTLKKRKETLFASLTQSFREYLEEEKNLIPNQYLLEDFYADIDVLEQDVARLEARLNRVRDHCENN